MLKIKIRNKEYTWLENPTRFIYDGVKYRSYPKESFLKKFYPGDKVEILENGKVIDSGILGDFFTMNEK